MPSPETIVVTDHDTAAHIEATCRRKMATLPPADWQHRAQRRGDLETIDSLLDEFNTAVSR